MNGSCLCGAVTYEIDAIDLPICHCHCNTCRKAHAAAFTSTAGVMREHFRWLSGQDELSSFESSPGKLRRFRYGLIRTPTTKRAIVKVHDEDRIELF